MRQKMHTTVRIWQITIITLGISLTFNESAHATLITIQINGTVTSASGSGLPATIHVSDVFTGTYTYDSSTPDSDVRSYRGYYQHDTPSGINVIFGGYEFKTIPDSTFYMQIWNNFTDSLGYSYDYYRIDSSCILNSSYCTIHWDITDNTQKAISSEALPVSAPVLSNWNHNHFQIMSGNSFLIDGIVTQAVLIPEPTLMLLLGLGSLLLRRK